MPSARVISIESIEHFRAALCDFGKDVQDTLCAVELELRRTADWLTQQGKHWQQQIRVRSEELTRAKIELEQRKHMHRHGRGPGHATQEMDFRKAQTRLREAEDKLAHCKRWRPLLDHAIREYQAPARQLAGCLETDLVQALAVLGQKLEALHAYRALAAPAAPVIGSGAAESATAAEPRGTTEPVPERPPEEGSKVP